MSQPPSADAIKVLLQELQLGSELISIAPLPGSYSNLTHLIEARTQAGDRKKFVVRRYVKFGSYDQSAKARREFEIFKLLLKHGIPGPEPLFLDADCDFLDLPGIVTKYVPGTQVIEPDDQEDWARNLAAVLSQIHRIPCEAMPTGYLLEGNREASWFAHTEEVPDFMMADPDGSRVWKAVRQLLPKITPVKDCLIHLDYWPGNILWHGDRITAVLDWEEAACGDPAIDVAYLRMNMMLDGLDEAAELFLRAYEVESGKAIANLGFWELCAAARPMFSPVSYELADKAKRGRFEKFIDGAMMGALNPGK